MIAWAYIVAFGALEVASGISATGNRPGEVECIHTTAPLSDRARLADGRTATLSPGIVRVGALRLTRCSGLPKAHPSAISAYGDKLAIGFRDGGVWLTSAKRGDQGRFIEDLPTAPVRGLAAQNGTLWIATGTQGLFAATDGGPATRSSHRLLGKRGITALAVDKQGHLHVAVDPRGHWLIGADGQARRLSRKAVGCFAGPNAKPKPPGSSCHATGSAPASSLPSDHITAMTRHRGKLVIGFFDQGIAIADGEDIEVLRGAPRFVNALLSVGGDLYIASPKGLYRRRGDGPFEPVNLGLASPHVNGLSERGGELAIATGAGVVLLKDGVPRILDERAGLPSPITYAATRDEDGALWVGTAAGLARIDGNGSVAFTESSGDIAHDWVTAVLPSPGGVFVGTYDAGVSRCTADGCTKVDAFGDAWINPHGLHAIAGGRIAATTLGDGLIIVDSEGHKLAAPRLPSEDVTTVARFGGRLWIGTRGGLARTTLSR